MFKPHDYLDARQIVPPHDYYSPAKIAKLTRSMQQNGWVGRPLLVEEETGFAWTGSHRRSVAYKLDIPVPVVYLDLSLIADDPEALGVHDLRDDEDRLKELERRGDHEAAELMMAEIRGNDEGQAETAHA